MKIALAAVCLWTHLFEDVATMTSRICNSRSTLHHVDALADDLKIQRSISFAAELDLVVLAGIGASPDGLVRQISADGM